MSNTHAIYTLVDNENLSYEDWIKAVNDDELDMEWAVKFYEAFQEKLEEVEREYDGKMEIMEEIEAELEDLRCELAVLRDEIYDLDYEEKEEARGVIADMEIEVKAKETELQVYIGVSKYGTAIDYFKATVKFDIL